MMRETAPSISAGSPALHSLSALAWCACGTKMRAHLGDGGKREGGRPDIRDHEDEVENRIVILRLIVGPGVEGLG